MRADAKTEDEIKAVVRDWFEAYSACNAAGVMSLMAPDQDITFIGTGAAEKRCGPEECRAGLEQDFARAESVDLDLSWLSVGTAGDAAWAAGDWSCHATAGGETRHLEGRFSVVAEKRRGRWYVVHCHLSLPAAERAWAKAAAAG